MAYQVSLSWALRGVRFPPQRIGAGGVLRPLYSQGSFWPSGKGHPVLVAKIRGRGCPQPIQGSVGLGWNRAGVDSGGYWRGLAQVVGVSVEQASGVCPCPIYGPEVTVGASLQREGPVGGSRVFGEARRLPGAPLVSGPGPPESS